MLNGGWFLGHRMPFYQIITSLFLRCKLFLSSYLTKVDEAILTAAYRDVCEEEKLPDPGADI